MKDSTIKNMYYNEQKSSEAQLTSKEYKAIIKLLSDNCTSFQQTLNEDQRQQFDMITSQNCELEDLASLESFSNGLKFGIRLIFEVFDD